MSLTKNKREDFCVSVRKEAKEIIFKDLRNKYKAIKTKFIEVKHSNLNDYIEEFVIRGSANLITVPDLLQMQIASYQQWFRVKPELINDNFIFLFVEKLTNQNTEELILVLVILENFYEKGIFDQINHKYFLLAINSLLLREEFKLTFYALDTLQSMAKTPKIVDQIASLVDFEVILRQVRRNLNLTAHFLPLCLILLENDCDRNFKQVH